MATAMSSGSGVKFCCGSTAVLRVCRWSGLVDVAPKLFRAWTALPYILFLQLAWT